MGLALSRPFPGARGGAAVTYRSHETLKGIHCPQWEIRHVGLAASVNLKRWPAGCRVTRPRARRPIRRARGRARGESCMVHNGGVAML
eukprot:3953934-Pyramimonas_sp.AAC.1